MGRLRSLGLTPQHIQRYVASGWIERIGVGAFQRINDKPTWAHALDAIQRDLGQPIHVGALTALEAHGEAHFMRPGGGPVFLFSATPTVLPHWFRKHDWGARIVHTRTKLLPPELGLTTVKFGGVSLRASCRERAILECLHLAPEGVDLMETFYVLEMLTTIRPSVMQTLLEACNSTKVVRLFLLMAERAALPVFPYLDLTKLDLGSGPRMIAKGGVYVAKYQLVVPRELAPGEVLQD
jgi:hypothetical protein